MQNLSAKAKTLVGAVVFLGVGILVQVPTTWGHPAYARFIGTLLVTLFAARLRVSLPRITGSMAVNLPFILLALSEFSLAEALLITGASTLVQCLWPESKQQPKLFKVAFNLSVTLMAAQAAWLAMRATPNPALALCFGALAYLFANTIPVAAIIALTENAHWVRTWKQIAQLTFPYFVLSAGSAGLAKLAAHAFSWYVPLAILPVMFLVQRSFVLYFQAIRSINPRENNYATAAIAGH
jgi:hypothetical protein